MKKIIEGGLILGLLCTASLGFAQNRPVKSKGPKTIEQKVDSVLALMTLEEKIGQLNLLTSDMDQTGASMRPQYKEDIRKGRVGSVFNAYGADYVRTLQKMAVEETRLHIPIIFGYDVIHGHKTIFPIPLAESCSWDLELMEKTARVSAIEAASMGLDWTFAPMVDIARDPRWGRVMEGAGEDTWLGSKIAEARVKGFQGKSLGDPLSIMACAKHYAAYGAAQAGRDYSTVDISERTLRETYLPPFKAAADAGAATFMTSFNELNGIPATANKLLLDQILRKEWNWKGFVVTDYTAIWELMFHGFAKDSAEAARKSIIAGSDMDMQSSIYMDHLPRLVKEGKVPVAAIDASVRRILQKKFELGLFSNPYLRMDKAREKLNVLNAENLKLCREAAKKSMVLLKNENQLLPITGKVRMALVGPLADASRDMMGAWSAAGDGEKNVSLLKAMSEVYTDLVRYEKGCELTDTSRKGFSAALELARNSDVVICALGEGAWQSGEAASRSDIRLPGVQEALLKALKSTGKPVVVVLFNGRPLDLSAVIPHADAVLEAWYPGSMAGIAVVEVLNGSFNPSGKLTMSFPRSVGQVPVFYNMKNTGRPFDANNKYTSKYLDVANEPLFPFGYGLSYSKFLYSNLQLGSKTIAAGKDLKVSVVLENKSRFDGEETVQLYIQDLSASVTRPVKELRNFQKVKLKAGESRTVDFTIKPEDLMFYNADMKWTLEKGDFKVFVGGSSSENLQARFTVE